MLVVRRRRVPSVERGVDGHPQCHRGEDPPHELGEDFAAELSEEAGERATPDETMRNSNTTKPPLKRKRSKKNKAMLMPLPPANTDEPTAWVNKLGKASHPNQPIQMPSNTSRSMSTGSRQSRKAFGKLRWSKRPRRSAS